MSPLRLRPPTPADADVVRAAHRDTTYTFALNDFDPDDDFDAWVDRCHRYRRGLDLPDGMVTNAFLLAEVDGVVVGRTSIRFELNDFLRRQGGHIGYVVLDTHRRHGHATEILRQSLIVARSVGVGDALLFCDDDNVASAKVIEANGGVQDGTVVDDEGTLTRRYWIR